MRGIFHDFMISWSLLLLWWHWRTEEESFPYRWLLSLVQVRMELINMELINIWSLNILNCLPTTDAVTNYDRVNKCGLVFSRWKTVKCGSLHFKLRWILIRFLCRLLETECWDSLLDDPGVHLDVCYSFASVLWSVCLSLSWNIEKTVFI